MSLFGTNMTAFTILGSSGHAFNNGIVTYGLMASSSGLVVPLSIFLIGTRVWALGKKLARRADGAGLLPAHGRGLAPDPKPSAATIARYSPAR
jgi:hypothetical protein